MSNRVNHYSRAEEKFAKAVILYARSGSSELYYDPEYADQVTEEKELEDMFLDGVVIKYEDEYVRLIRPLYFNGDCYTCFDGDGGYIHLGLVYPS